VQIALQGGAWYADQGAAGCKGLRFFSISGDVKRPAAYEVPIGMPLGELIEMAGGTLDGKPPAAIAASGPSGGFIPARLPVPQRVPDELRPQLTPGETHFSALDLPLDLGLFRKLGLMLGAGIVVYGQGRDMLDQALNCSRFFSHESCGKCVPCRIGSQKLVEIAQAVSAAPAAVAGSDATRELVRQLAEAMTMTSICGLGAAAPNPLLTWFKYFHADGAPPSQPDRPQAAP